MNPQIKPYVGLVVVTVALFGGLLYLGSRDKSQSPTGAAHSVAFDDSAPVKYFYSDTCYYCKLQKPILDELAGEGYRVKPMDLLANPALGRPYNVTGTPTFVAENGDRVVGLQEKEVLRKFLDAHGGKTVPLD